MPYKVTRPITKQDADEIEMVFKSAMSAPNIPSSLQNAGVITEVFLSCSVSLRALVSCVDPNLRGIKKQCIFNGETGIVDMSQRYSSQQLALFCRNLAHKIKEQATVQGVPASQVAIVFEEVVDRILRYYLTFSIDHYGHPCNRDQLAKVFFELSDQSIAAVSVVTFDDGSTQTVIDSSSHTRQFVGGVINRTLKFDRERL